MTDHHVHIGQFNEIYYELCGNSNVEWYDSIGKSSAPDYHSAIWIPVRRKNKE